ncbi:hypothetical protein GCK32_008463 [Trichostrongylus colubriformis]|uniref:Uncharacterized protein n=1 Tax=Trichostrongylus colubriformis TaxID=6319 RepID=A0AAN8FDS6_TRICO
MGYPASWVAPWIAITTYSAIILVVQLGSFFAATIISLFIFRCHIITPTDHFSKINSRGHIYKSAIVFLTYIVPAMISTNDFLPDQEEARTWAEQVTYKSNFNTPCFQ